MTAPGRNPGRRSAAEIRARIEDLTWMARTGESAYGAARRLGTTPSALEHWARRHLPYDVWHQLVQRNPRDHNANTWINWRAA